MERKTTNFDTIICSHSYRVCGQFEYCTQVRSRWIRGIDADIYDDNEVDYYGISRLLIRGRAANWRCCRAGARRAALFGKAH